MMDEYLKSVIQWGDLLSNVMEEEGTISDAAMFLQCIGEDAKQRLANTSRAGKLHRQLQVMASNLKPLAAALKDGDLADGVLEEDDDLESVCDSLLGWGDHLFPKGVVVLEDKHSIRSIACSGQRALYVTDAGDVFSVGDNGTGVPSSLMSQDSMTPKVIGELVLERVLMGRRVVSVACGHLHSVALTQGGRLWSWGSGEYGRLGHGDEADQPAPRLCEALLSCHVRAIACGGAHTVAVVSPSRVFSWGLGRSGRLGLNDSLEHNFNTPQLVDVDNRTQALSDACQALLGIELSAHEVAARDEPILGVACGWAFTLLLGANGTVRAFGAGTDGQCGILPAVNQYAPLEIDALVGLNIVQVSCGYHHCVAVTSEGIMYSWGNGAEGQLGKSNTVTRCDIPTRINVGGRFKTSIVSAGQFHSICVTHSGQLWGWGNNLHGAIDQNSDDSFGSHIIWEPRPIKPIGKLQKGRTEIVRLVAAGAHFTIAVATQGTAVCDSESCSSPGSVDLNNSHLIDCFSQTKEKRANGTLRLQYSSGSFCGGRVGFWQCERFVGRIGVLSSNGILEMYKQLDASTPEEVLDVRGHDVDIRCRANILEAWRTHPGYECTLLLRLKMNSNVEASAWAKELNFHATSDSVSPNAMVSSITGRKAAWQQGIGNQLRITPELYLIYKERATRQEGIGLDVRRTLPSLLLFGKRGEPLYDQLREVLEVYQCYRPDVGYVQGMSYVAAMLCLHIPNSPYESFVCLANLLASHHLFDLYRLGQSYDRVQGYYKVLDLIISKTSSRLWKHLNALGMMDEIHVSCFQWLQTLFVRRMPLETVTVLWDAFLCRRDTTVMMRACVAVLLCKKSSILQAHDQEDVLILMRSQPKVDDFMRNVYSHVQVPQEAREKLRGLLDLY